MNILKKIEDLLAKLKKDEHNDELGKEAYGLLNSVELLSALQPEEVKNLRESLANAGVDEPNSLSSANRNESATFERIESSFWKVMKRKQSSLTEIINQILIHNNAIQNGADYPDLDDEFDKLLELANRFIEELYEYKKFSDKAHHEMLKRNGKNIATFDLEKDFAEISSHAKEIKNFVFEVNSTNFFSSRRELNISIQLLSQLLKVFLGKEQTLFSSPQ